VTIILLILYGVGALQTYSELDRHCPKMLTIAMLIYAALWPTWLMSILIPYAARKEARQ
jgi:hypothetical protein